MGFKNTGCAWMEWSACSCSRGTRMRQRMCPAMHHLVQQALTFYSIPEATPKCKNETEEEECICQEEGGKVWDHHHLKTALIVCFVWYCLKGLQNVRNIFEGNFLDVFVRFILWNIGPEVLLSNDGQPVEGAKVTIECGDLRGMRVFTAMELSEGKYIFEDAISVPYELECELIAEKDG